MSFEVGPIIGKLELDRSQWKASLQAAPGEAAATVAALDEALKATVTVDTRGASTGLYSLGEAASNVKAALGGVSAPASLGQIAFQSQSAATGLGQAAGGAAQAGQAAAAAAPRATTLANALTGTAAAATQAGSQLSVMGVAIGSALGGLATGGIGLLAEGLHGVEKAAVGFVETSIKLAAQNESTALSFKVMLGDAGQAKSLLKDIRDFANATPFQFNELADAGRQLVSANVASRDIVSTLRMLGDVASGVNKPIGDLAYLFSQIKSRGSASEMELREFAIRTVPIYDALEKSLHKNREEIDDMTRSGQIGIGEVEAAFRSMTSEGGRFYRMTEEQAQTAQGLASTLADAWTTMEVQLGQALIKGTDGKNLLRDITDEITKVTPAAVEAGVALADAFKNAMPWIEAAAKKAEDIAQSLGLIDRYKENGSPLQGPKNSELVGSLQGNGEDLQHMLKLWNSSVAASNAAANFTGKIASVTSPAAMTNDPHLGEEGAAYMVNYSKRLAAINADGQRLNELIDRASKGQSIDATEFDRLKKRLAEVMDFAEQGRELNSRARISLGASSFLDPGAKDYFEKVGQNLRDLNAIATPDIDLLKLRKAYADEQNKPAADATKAKAAADAKATEAPSDSDSPGVSSRHKGKGSQYSLADAASATQVAAFEAAGDKQGADIERAWSRFQTELKRIKEAETEHDLSPADAEKARELANQQFQSQRDVIRERIKKEKDADKQKDEEKQRDSAKRVQEYEVAAMAAGMRSRGDLLGAELVEFDGRWKQRIATAKDGEERITANAAYEAERREKIHELGLKAIRDLSVVKINPAPTNVKDAQSGVRRSKAGSGDRELARLDLREQLGKLTADERARRDRLAERSGRKTIGPTDASARGMAGDEWLSPSSDLPKLPRSIAEMVAPAAQPPVRSINPVVSALAGETVAPAALPIGPWHAPELLGHEKPVFPLNAVAAAADESLRMKTLGEKSLADETARTERLATLKQKMTIDEATRNDRLLAMHGKMDADERLRSMRLQSVFGAGGSFSAFPFGLSIGAAAAPPQLTLPSRRTPGGNAGGGTDIKPNVNVSLPPIDADRLAKAVADRVDPKIRYYIDQLGAGFRASNHADGLRSAIL